MTTDGQNQYWNGAPESTKDQETVGRRISRILQGKIESIRCRIERSGS
jgi:hypothetical protein